LVRLTGQNFGGDWKAWGDWWNSQSGQPRFNPATVRWYRGQPDPDLQANSLAEKDRSFIKVMRAKGAGNQLPPEADEPDDKK
jgi:hypothetical protein